MNIKINKTIGSGTVQFEFEEEDTKKSIGLVSVLTSPDYCGNCKKTNIIYDQNLAQTDEGAFLYIKRRCLSCTATSTLGEYKQKMGFFWKKWEIYKADSSKGQEGVGEAINLDDDGSPTEVSAG